MKNENRKEYEKIKHDYEKRFHFKIGVTGESRGGCSGTGEKVS